MGGCLACLFGLPDRGHSLKPRYMPLRVFRHFLKKDNMKAGDLRHYCSIQTPTTAADDFGLSGTVSWSVFGYVWAAIWPVSAKERVSADKVEMVATHRIRIRYLSGILPKMRVMFGSRTFEIVSIVNFEERNIFIDLLCNEVI